MAASNTLDTEFQMHARNKEHINNIIDDLAGVRTALAAVNTLLAGFLEGSKTHDFGNLVDGAGESTDVTVTGAALGDYAMVSLGVDSVDLLVTANVTATDTVTVRVQNETTGAVDLASTTVRVLVIDRSVVLAALSALPSLLASKT